MGEEGGSVDGNAVKEDRRKLVRKAERDAWNRLMSIQLDTAWVQQFCKANVPHLPVVPNLRCGAWYVPSTAAVPGCYFKSTDGHTNEWSFSLKRYNAALLSVVLRLGGCVVVDSTRRGKSMPDALSKTVPIWCAVLNQASRRRYGEPSNGADGDLHLPDHMISPSEAEQIRGRIDDWTEDLLESDLQVHRLDKPLRPLFVTPDHVDPLLSSLQDSTRLDHYPLVLVSASPKVPTPDITPKQYGDNERWRELCRKVGDTELATLQADASFVYVQGSGDDEEMWSTKLTPAMLWDVQNLRAILETRGEQSALESCIQSIVSQDLISRMTLSDSDTNSDVRIGPFNIWLGRRSPEHRFTEEELQKYSLIVQADGRAVEHGENEKGEGCKQLQLQIEHGKRGLHAFRSAIPTILEQSQRTLPDAVLLCSAEGDGIGHDLNAGFAVCILSTVFDSDQRLITLPQDVRPYIPPTLTKEDVHRRLQWIATYLPHAKAPSRKHMLRINEALLSQDFRRNSMA